MCVIFGEKLAFQFYHRGGKRSKTQRFHGQKKYGDARRAYLR